MLRSPNFRANHNLQNNQEDLEWRTERDIREETVKCHTLGFDEPAKPALILAVPLSITIGWFKRREPPSVSTSSVAVLMVTACRSYGMEMDTTDALRPVTYYLQKVQCRDKTRSRSWFSPSLPVDFAPAHMIQNTQRWVLFFLLTWDLDLESIPVEWSRLI